MKKEDETKVKAVIAMHNELWGYASDALNGMCNWSGRGLHKAARILLGEDSAKMLASMNENFFGVKFRIGKVLRGGRWHRELIAAIEDRTYFVDVAQIPVSLRTDFKIK